MTPVHGRTSVEVKVVRNALGTFWTIYVDGVDHGGGRSRDLQTALLEAAGYVKDANL